MKSFLSAKIESIEIPFNVSKLKTFQCLSYLCTREKREEIWRSRMTNNPKRQAVSIKHKKDIFKWLQNDFIDSEDWNTLWQIIFMK